MNFSFSGVFNLLQFFFLSLFCTYFLKFFLLLGFLIYFSSIVLIFSLCTSCLIFQFIRFITFVYLCIFIRVTQLSMLSFRVNSFHNFCVLFSCLFFRCFISCFFTFLSMTCFPCNVGHFVLNSKTCYFYGFPSFSYFGSFLAVVSKKNTFIYIYLL